MSELKQGIFDLITPEVIKSASPQELYTDFSNAAMAEIIPNWNYKIKSKRACYLSAEFLVGRLIDANLFNIGKLQQAKDILRQNNLPENLFEDVSDDALGNGGLGRLAACFLDSAATQNIPLDGFGIRYRYGLFKQKFENGYQTEHPDNWLAVGDPWSIRREQERITIYFGDQTVYAMPYDMPIIGYKNGVINTLRLWQSEAINEFDFDSFNRSDYKGAVDEKTKAEAISAVLYPNDNDEAGKVLRLKQEYFFSSATIQTLVKRYKQTHGNDFSAFSDMYAIQLNDTHPTVAIPELMRILISEEQIPFCKAFDISQKTFAYTNHTIMSEALEKWSISLINSTLPQIYPYVVMIDDRLKRDLSDRGINPQGYRIIEDGCLHMARMAIYLSHSVNGVAQLHSEIIKSQTLNNWYKLYPERFNNKTNGITQRRWLAVSNPELSAFITKRCGDGWITDLTRLKSLETHAVDNPSLDEFIKVKQLKKQQLKDYVVKRDNFILNTGNVFDIQIKRLHEYKRQLLNAFSILDIYFRLKDGSLKNLQPVSFIFGAKAAPGYRRAKGIIKYINEIANLINYDNDVNRIMQVVFVSDYNVSYAEKLIPAADISEQISTAGTEASGTSNMKFMLNGAITLGTLDGANIEIIEQAGAKNNYIFGATSEEISQISDRYNPKKLYDETPRIKRVVDTLINGSFFDGNSGIFKDIYDSLLFGSSYEKPDKYYLLLDFLSYCDSKVSAINDTADKLAFAKKCILNTANSGKFSSDRTIKQYASEIWGI